MESWLNSLVVATRRAKRIATNSISSSIESASHLSGVSGAGGVGGAGGALGTTPVHHQKVLLKK